MRRLLHLVILSTAILSPVIGVAGAHRAPARTQNDTGNAADVVSGVVVVKLKPGVGAPAAGLFKGQGALGNLLAKEGATSIAPAFRNVRTVTASEAAAGIVDLSRLFVVHIPQNLDPREVARQLSGSDLVEYAEPKYVNHLYGVPNDPSYVAQQSIYFNRMNVPAGWDVVHGDTNVIIADVDGGTKWQHEDLNGNLWINRAEDINHNGRYDPTPAGQGGDIDGIDQDGNGFVDDVIGWNFASNSGDPQGLPSALQSGLHGTATASHFGAVTDNGIGMAGTSWNCRLMAICTASPAVDNQVDFGYEGIQYAFMNGASVINASWGRTGGFSQAEQDVITAAAQSGALVVAAAGNGISNVGKDNDLLPDYPAAYKHVLAVGATDKADDVVAAFSNFGLSVPVYAPGMDIWSANSPTGYYDAGSGTSFSTPLVSGLAGLLKSLHPAWTPEQVAAQIRVTADSIDAVNPGKSGAVGRGRVNFGRALTEVRPGIEIDSAVFSTPAGREFFISGDTIIASITVRNVLPVAATDLQLTLSSSSGVVQVVQGSASVPVLNTGDRFQIPNIILRTGPTTSALDVLLKLSWISNSNDRDAAAFKVTILPQIPFWLVQNSPTNASLFGVKAVDTSVAWAAGGNGGSSPSVVIRTRDGGAQWTMNSGNLPALGVFCVGATDSLHAWIGTDDGRIFATTNGGTIWSTQAYPLPASPFIDAFWFFDAQNGFALGDPPTVSNKFVILHTTDGGTTWVRLTNAPLVNPGESGFNNSFWWSDANHGWFGTNANHVYRTTDGGASWSVATTTNALNLGVAFSDNSTGLVVENAGVVERSVDGGASWASSPSPSTSQFVACAYVAGTDTAWITDGTSLFRTVDNAVSWQKKLSAPVQGTVIHLSLFGQSAGWAVTSGGEILKYNPNAPEGEVPIVPTVSTLDTLSLNRPNPFGSKYKTTRIDYYIHSPEHVTLKVYDLLGRLVATLIDNYLPAGGGSVVFSGGNRASGVYLYRIQTDSFSATKKMLIVH